MELLKGGGIMAVSDYLKSLQKDKQTLVDNLVAKGVNATSNETFTSLVPKINDIKSGGDEELEASFMSSIDNSLGANVTKLPSGLTSIGNNAFQSCTNLELTELPNDITSIGNSAFYSCSKLALKKLPENVTYIGNNAFYNCDNLALEELPNGITSIGSNAFQSCEKIQLTELPDGITSIGNSAFANCTNLALTKLPSNLTTLGNECFMNCRNITINEIPSGVTQIGTYCFYDTKKITNLTINGTIKTIPRYAFYTSGLTELIINSPVTTIADNALQHCSNLSKIVFNNITSVPSLGSTSLSGTAIASENGYIYVPDILVDSFKSASNWSTYASQIKPISEMEDA